MKVAFDLDGTLCKEMTHSEKQFAIAIEEAKRLVNEVYDGGHTVAIYTARNWSEYRMTKEWLDTNGFKYHLLILGKYNYDLLLDDRATNNPTVVRVECLR